MHSPDPDAVGSRHGALASNPAPDVVHKKGEWSYRAQWWVKHTKGMEAFMAIGVHGQRIYLDVDRNIAIIKQSSQPFSKDTVLNGLDLDGFYAVADYLSKK